MTRNRAPTPVYLDPGMHPGLEGLTKYSNEAERADYDIHDNFKMKKRFGFYCIYQAV